MQYADSMLSSEALRKAAARCHVHLSTSFRWHHRFLKLADYLNTPVLTGIVEADQTMSREAFKGKRKIAKRPVRKRGNDNKKGVTWVPVLVARDRSAGEADFVLKHVSLPHSRGEQLPSTTQGLDPAFSRCRHPISTPLSWLVSMVRS